MPQSKGPAELTQSIPKQQKAVASDKVNDIILLNVWTFSDFDQCPCYTSGIHLGDAPLARR